MNTRKKYAELKEEFEQMNKDTIVDSVVASYRQRSLVGIKKYNKTLDRNDLSLLDWL